MYSDAKKIHLIEKILGTNDESILDAIDRVFNENLTGIKHKTIGDLFGVMNSEDGDAILKAIEETSENIHPDDWK
jgi:hypothetical protein